MIPPTWVGVDPGGVSTGVVVRHGHDLLWHVVLVRDIDEDHGQGVGVGPGYIADVLAAIRTARYQTVDPTEQVGIAVELVVPPSAFINGKKKFTDPGPAIATGMVLGAVLARHPDAVRVRPNHHGEGTLGGYPAALITPSERRCGLTRNARHGSSISHARAAWDTAGRGAELARGVRRLQILSATGSPA